MSHKKVNAKKVTSVELHTFICEICKDLLVEPQEEYGDALKLLLKREDVRKVKDTDGTWKHSCCHESNSAFKDSLQVFKENSCSNCCNATKVAGIKLSDMIHALTTGNIIYE